MDCLDSQGSREDNLRPLQTLLVSEQKIGDVAQMVRATDS